ncbi:hypothetical protein CLV56_3165 [Mumia flava]|uniref:Uncharacterized protein n=1 Tax=Mumia flava TaxID=1348852 RepID=A0A0B2BPC8_9ACTN|nr:hypothetical protein [Mumia flava]PJJ53674.1 hypothetical protein CLV56_3165 [Mumia flava]
MRADAVVLVILVVGVLAFFAVAVPWLSARMERRGHRAAATNPFAVVDRITNPGAMGTREVVDLIERQAAAPADSDDPDDPRGPVA